MSPSQTSSSRRVVMFVINAFTHDARVAREATALGRAGYDVTVLAVRRSMDLPAREERDGFVVERLDLTTGSLGGLRRRFGRARTAVANAGRPASTSTGSAGPRQGLRAYLAPITRTISALQYCLVAARRAREIGPDLYHCHDFHTLFAGFLARRRHSAPVIYDSHELWAHLNIEHPTLKRTRRIAVEVTEGFFARRSAGVITVSEAFADHLVARHRIPRPVVLLNVPDIASAPADVEVPRSIADHDRVLLYVGGIQANRGIDQCVRALPSIPDARLVLLGPAVPSEESALRALAESLGVTDRVVFEPPVPAVAVPAIASHASVGIVPFLNTCLSHYLTLPNKLFESIHAGLPVIASDFPEFRRIVEGEGVGIVCDTADPAAIASAANRILGDGELAARFRSNTKSAAERYNWEIESAKLTGLYAKVLAS